MSEPVAYLSGRWIPATQAAIAVTDAGFVLGTTVAEQIRTFKGRLFRLEQHLSRLFHSLSIVDVDPGLSVAQFAEIANELVGRNHPLLASGDDLAVTVFVTPGDYREVGSNGSSRATVGLNALPVAFASFASRYAVGEALTTTDIQQTSSHCWPRELKCRSRMHYYLADRQAHARHPGSRALMLDADGTVTEATSANIAIYLRNEGIVMPPRAAVLPGISLAVLLDLAVAQGIPVAERPLRPADVGRADEVLLTSTSSCVLPVVQFNGRPIASGGPGHVFRGLLAAWSELVGVDIAAQAVRFANR